jgi:hypothetical protein
MGWNRDKNILQKTVTVVWKSEWNAEKQIVTDNTGIGT